MPEKRRQQIPGYKLIERLGSGGQANVYKAVQISMNRLVAVKVIPPGRVTGPSDLKRFFREARVLARLRHENIVQAIDYGDADGIRYLVMEFVEGTSVLDLIDREGALGLKRSLETALQLCNALEHAAGLGVIHRDIKPANILISKDGQALLVDFGLARPQVTNLQVTLVGTSMGTPHYMPPEQILGESELDARVDIYALGSTLFHMLTGRVPFPKSTREGILGSHLWEPIEVPENLDEGIPDFVFSIIRRAMEKDRDRRYPSAHEMALDLQAALHRAQFPSVGWEEPANPKLEKEVEVLTRERDRLAKENRQLSARLAAVRRQVENLRTERNTLADRLEEK